MSVKNILRGFVVYFALVLVVSAVASYLYCWRSSEHAFFERAPSRKDILSIISDAAPEANTSQLTYHHLQYLRKGMYGKPRAT